MQKPIFKQPHFVLWITIPVILFISFFRKSAILEIQLYDTYYVVTEPFLGGFFSVFLLFNGLVYWVLRKSDLIRSATWIHVTGSVLTVLFLVALAASAEKANLSGTFLSPAEFQRDQEHNTQVVFAILIWIVCQILFLLNVVMGLIRGRIRK